MLGSLYLIRNNINNKVYVGKTYKSIETRFNEHISDSKRHPTRKLYKAFHKYGIDKFYIELISIIEQDLLEDKEIQLILEYDSFNNGYNSTLGGDGRRYLQVPEKEIIETYKDCFNNMKEASRVLKIDTATVKKILLANNVLDSVNLSKVRGTTVYCAELDIEWDSISDCARFLIETEVATSKDVHTVRSNLSRHLYGHRPRFCGYVFNLR